MILVDDDDDNDGDDDDDRPLDLCIRTRKKSNTIWSPASLCENERTRSPHSEKNTNEDGSLSQSSENWNSEIFSLSPIQTSSIDRSFQVRFTSLSALPLPNFFLYTIVH